MKLSDGKFACNACYPFPTKLMDQKGVMDDEFKRKRLSSAEVDKLITYQTDDKKRQTSFKAEETYLDGELLVDRHHMWFRLKEYEEVFFIQQVEVMGVSEILEKDGRYCFVVGLVLNNKYYKRLFIDAKVKPDAFFRKNQIKQVLDDIVALHEKFCPHAVLRLDDLQ